MQRIVVRHPFLVLLKPRLLYIGQDEAELARLRAQTEQARNRIALDTRKAFLQLRKADTARNVARLDLDVAREQLSILLAQFGAVGLSPSRLPKGTVVSIFEVPPQTGGG